MESLITLLYNRAAKGKEKIEGQDRPLASKTTGVEEGEDGDGITATATAPYGSALDKDSVLVLGDWNDEHNYGVHKDDGDLWSDRSCSSSDTSKDEFPDKTETACESNQYGEMFSSATKFGKLYLAPGNQERQEENTFRGVVTDSRNGTSNHSEFIQNRESSRAAPTVSLAPAVSEPTIK
ncbi:hypothetical protein BG004_002740 [Podila humilis]|nr:hypothetical protein BG004_002740 [Podila humilis]